MASSLWSFAVINPSLKRVLAWLWVLCAGLTVLTICVPPLEFSSFTYRSVAHSIAWSLAFTGAGYFAKRTSSPALLWLLRWIPRIQWAGVGLVLAGLWWYGALYIYYFFLSAGSPNDTQLGKARILMRRGDAYVLYRNVAGHPSQYGTLALVRPVSPFFNWVRPITSGEYDSWANTNKPANHPLRDLGNLSAAIDSSNAATDKEPLPLATHTGLGTLGYAVNGKNRHILNAKNMSLFIKHKGFFNLESYVDEQGGNISLSIILSHFQGVGTYQMTCVDGPAVVDNRLYVTRNGQTYKSVSSRPATLDITHFDAARHIIAGTFSGVLHSAARPDSITISQGRFDAHYQ